MSSAEKEHQQSEKEKIQNLCDDINTTNSNMSYDDSDDDRFDPCPLSYSSSSSSSASSSSMLTTSTSSSASMLAMVRVLEGLIEDDELKYLIRASSTEITREGLLSSKPATISSNELSGEGNEENDEHQQNKRHHLQQQRLQWLNREEQERNGYFAMVSDDEEGHDVDDILMSISSASSVSSPLSPISASCGLDFLPPTPLVQEMTVPALVEETDSDENTDISDTSSTGKGSDSMDTVSIHSFSTNVDGSYTCTSPLSHPSSPSSTQSPTSVLEILDDEELRHMIRLSHKMQPKRRDNKNNTNNDNYHKKYRQHLSSMHLLQHSHDHRHFAHHPQQYSRPGSGARPNSHDREKIDEDDDEEHDNDSYFLMGQFNPPLFKTPQFLPHTETLSRSTPFTSDDPATSNPCKIVINNETGIEVLAEQGILTENTNGEDDGVRMELLQLVNAQENLRRELDENEAERDEWFQMWWSLTNNDHQYDNEEETVEKYIEKSSTWKHGWIYCCPIVYS